MPQFLIVIFPAHFQKLTANTAAATILSCVEAGFVRWLRT